MKEEEIRPQDLFQKYVELSAQDARIFFSNSERIEVNCVACGSMSKTIQSVNQTIRNINRNICQSLLLFVISKYIGNNIVRDSIHSSIPIM